MSLMAFSDLQQRPVDAGFWPALAEQAIAWLASRQLPLRDAIVLVPYAQLLAPAREAFARCGGWQPRVETTRTLAASVAPPLPASPGTPRFDPVTDLLAADTLLRRQPWGAAWARSDPRGFARGVGSIVSTTHALADAAHATAPARRSDWWSRARELLAPVHGPGATERLLARVALEWAASAETPASDALFGLRPSAWVAVSCGGADALTEALLAESVVPVLHLQTDPAPGTGWAADRVPVRWVAESLEHEAQGAALAVLDALDAGRAPVALMAQDRLLVRRVRALLDRHGVALNDETGWKLSTTRAAARVMAVLRAASPRASADHRLDWLKTDAATDPPALAALERHWRRREAPLDAAAVLWQAAQQRLSPLQDPRRQTLAGWLSALDSVLRSGAGDAALADDAAGRQLRAVLRLDHAQTDEDWRSLAQQTRFDLEGFTAWVDATLEQAIFVPPAESDAPVVIVPMARAMLRPFGAVVFPGTDHKRLGGPIAPHPLLSDAVAAALGLDHAGALRERERRTVAQLLRAPHLVLMRRRSEGAEVLAESPLLENVLGAEASLRCPEAALSLPVTRLAAQPVGRPAPVVPRVPQQLSASAVEALRECPYRFFARVSLRLAEPSELDAELEKRDYGNWLHAVLHRFHATREPGADRAADLARLVAAADALQAEQRLDEAQLLPFRAAFDALAPHYVAWQRARDGSGWAFADGETAGRAEPPALAGVVLHGRIDRIDRLGQTQTAAAVWQLIDYKTGSVESLKQRVREPLEDTQLAFYAALVTDRGGDLQAAYVALDERRGPTVVEHPAVQASAAALVEGLAGDLAQLRAGSGLAALGEEPVCGRCEVRGLCRRDHWSTGA